MSREVRRVPPNWNHPKNGRGNPQPMFNQDFESAFQEWLSDFDRIRRGELNKYEEDYKGNNPLAQWLQDNKAPDPAYYKPWKDEEATWFQVWETVSEGSPVTPPFETKEELIAYLVEGGDDWNRKYSEPGYTQKQAEDFVEAGWVPSMVMFTSPGKKPTMVTGIAIASAIKDSKV